jgi:hypothetical protein
MVGGDNTLVANRIAFCDARANALPYKPYGRSCEGLTLVSTAQRR